MKTIAGIIILLLMAGGCQKRVTLDSWKQSVEHYVWSEANGDASVLRDLPTSSVHKGFSVISENSPHQATDIHGVLLGHRQIAGQNFFVFLVGVNQKQKVSDIRLAAMQPSPEGFVWHMTRKNSESFTAYRNFKDAAWRALFPDRQNPPWSHSGFPGEGDQFKLSIAGSRVTATHQQSGANWTLEVPQDGPTTRPTVAGSNWSRQLE
jgi:hypothetical protein